MTNGNCNLPCFWGIRPGKTSWKETKAFLETLNTLYKWEDKFRDGGFPIYSIGLDITTIGPVITFSILPTFGEDKVQRLHVHVEGNTNTSNFHKYWMKYSIREVFRQLGPPDKVYVSVTDYDLARGGYGLLILYQKQKAAFWLQGERAESDKICPQFGESDEIPALDISLANPESDLDIVPRDWIPPSASSHWSSIQEGLQMNEKDFYRRVLAEKPACFEVKVTMKY